jgi:hypothetical protein
MKNMSTIVIVDRRDDCGAQRFVRAEVKEDERNEGDGDGTS